jgi:hypothetical protein
VADHEFLFEIELRGPIPSREMLSQLASQMFEHVGCSSADLPRMVDELQSAVAACASATPVGLRFRAHGGRLEIDVTSGGGAVWHASRQMA